MIKVGILEDDPDFLDYLSELIGRADDMLLLFAHDSVGAALDEVQHNPADIYLVDLQLPDGNGMQLVKTVKSKRQSGKALILTVLGDKASVMVAFENGANGYLLKDTPPQQILRDIRAVMDGGNPISPQAATHLLTLLSTPPQALPQEENILTERERDVLLMFSRGLSYKETASSLNISTHTVADYVKSIYRKLSVHSRSEAIFEAVQNGWLDI